MTRPPQCARTGPRVPSGSDLLGRPRWRAPLPVLVAVATLALLTQPTGAQVVRGVVTERSTGAPVAGVLVTAEPAGISAGPRPDGASTVSSVLSNQAGEYAIRLPGPGRYRVAAKRIGVMRHVSEEFDLALGETKRLDLQIDAVAVALPEVLVSGLCVTRRNQLPRIAALWDEARTALTATQISLRDRLFEARVLRYENLLDPRTLRVLNEWRQDISGLVERPFTSISGDSLSVVGFWRELPGDSVEYHGPDADVLASNAFIRDHCFSLMDGAGGGSRDRIGLVGLAFEPARGRNLPDIRGTLWIDSRTFELRFVEFRYTRLPSMPNIDRSGGEVHFARLPTGAWIVRRWFIRMPQFGDVRSGNWLTTAVRYLREDGGDLASVGLDLSRSPAAVTGTLRDSAGAPMEGVVVRLAGTHRETRTDSRGAFQLDSLPAGRFSIIAEQAGYSAFDLLAAEQQVTLSAGVTARTALRAYSSTAMVQRLCDGRPPVRDRATLRLLMLDSATSAPFPGIRFALNWSDGLSARGDLAALVRPMQRVTDTKGTLTFCEVPSGLPLEVSLVGADRQLHHIMVITLNPNQVAAHVVRGRMPSRGNR